MSSAIALGWLGAVSAALWVLTVWVMRQAFLEGERADTAEVEAILWKASAEELRRRLEMERKKNIELTALCGVGMVPVDETDYEFSRN